MATTTNYGWTTPDDTALVKDGASAIRTLGSSVDTTTKNLNPETTLGDIAYRSSTANVKTRLGLGTAGQVLQVNSGASAPEWATFAGGGMTLISTTSLTGASVTISSIPQTYNSIQLVIKNYKPANDNVYLFARANGITSTSYLSANTNNNNQGNLAFAFDDNQWYVLVSDNSVDEGTIVMEFYNYTSTTTRKFGTMFGFANNPTTTTSMNIANKLNIVNDLSALTSLTFFPETGNFTSGSILMYGVK